MIRLDIKRLLALRGIRYGRAYLLKHGFTVNEVRGLLGRPLVELRFEVLTRICITFDCLPNDVLTWDGDPKSHLIALVKPPAPDVPSLLQGKSPSEIEEILRRLSGGK